ncbi:hypothetical protein CTAYLR_007617 [Chrysophaeum taylorii]|uniref:Swiss Army Knife protein DSP-PTPase phosphatase domain-containing protein n=1 Tax=Chrysophaeum taylorii TaxID=2483200 RepID=A0AAD7U6D5_9STRA|nr:hypothetical protein CTAYLR_007617 [Chrysophaeum taylorii]
MVVDSRKRGPERSLAPPCNGPENPVGPTTLLGSPRDVNQNAKLVGLPTLEPLEVIAEKRSAYCGPTDESNWVLPGRLMVGAFPGMPEDEENARMLTSILRMGVTTFVCLQREYDPRATEDQWRNGSALRPYFGSAVDIAAQLDDEPKRQLSFLHFGIEDCNVGEDAAVTKFAVDLAERLRATNEVVYLHCWGGHGRTGTIVCLLLHLLYGVDDRSALVRCQFVHDTRRIPIAVGSPQTPKQRDQVCRIISRLQRDDVLAKKRLASEKISVEAPVAKQVSFDENDCAVADAVAAAEEAESPQTPKTSKKSRTPASLPRVDGGAQSRVASNNNNKPKPRAPHVASRRSVAKGNSPRHHRLHVASSSS